MGMLRAVPPRQCSGTGVPVAGVGTSGPEGSGQLAPLGHQALVLSRWVATVAIVIGSLVLAGWALGIGSLKAVVPGLATMKANTAFAFVLCGVVLWLASCDLARLPTTRACAAAVAAIGLLTLCQYALGWQLGIDQLLFRADEGDVLHPGRMAPATAVSFILLGVAFLTLDARPRGGRWPAQWLALAVAFGASLALLGYAYGVESLYRVGAYSSIAAVTHRARERPDFPMYKRSAAASVSASTVSGLVRVRYSGGALSVKRGWGHSPGGGTLRSAATASPARNRVNNNRPTIISVSEGARYIRSGQESWREPGHRRRSTVREPNRMPCLIPHGRRCPKLALSAGRAL